jgi:hypothetical protein
MSTLVFGLTREISRSSRIVSFAEWLARARRLVRETTREANSDRFVFVACCVGFGVASLLDLVK